MMWFDTSFLVCEFFKYWMNVFYALEAKLDNNKLERSRPAENQSNQVLDALEEILDMKYEQSRL